MTELTAGDPVRLLKALIDKPSVTPEDAGVLTVLETTLTEIGFTVTRKTFDGDGSYPVDNLFAIRDRGGRTLLFGGHTDVVPAGDTGAWSSDPFVSREAEGRIYGRGAADMKSGVAAFVSACAKAVPDGSADAGTIVLIITNDEEADSINGTDKVLQWAAGRGQKYDFAIVGEPSSAAILGDSIKIGRRGSLSGHIVVEGIQGHAAYPDRTRNPVPVMAGIVMALKTEAIDAGTPHFPASNLEVTTIDVGNPAGNIIPARGTMAFNIRFNDLWTPETLKAWCMERIASVPANDCRVTVTWPGRPASAFLSPLGADVDLLGDAIAAKTGTRPVHATFGGTSDARFIAAYCPVVECGLVGLSMHQIDEHCLISDLTGLTDIYHDFIGRFLAAKP